ncbi:hypothetical protein MRX96_043076 [Rhipicephalus microplus]
MKASPRGPWTTCARRLVDSMGKTLRLALQNSKATRFHFSVSASRSAGLYHDGANARQRGALARRSVTRLGKMTCAAAMRIDGALRRPAAAGVCKCGSFTSLVRPSSPWPTGRWLRGHRRNAPDRHCPLLLDVLLPSSVAHRYTVSACSACFPHATL